MSDIYLAVSETPTVVTLTSAVINSAVASSVTVMNTVTVALDANSLSALENVTVTVGAAITGTVTVGNFPATQAVSLASVPTHAISGTVTANLNLPSFAGSNGDSLTSAVQIGYFDADSGEFRKVDSQYNPLPISGAVTVGNSVTVSALPVSLSTTTIGGTARLNVTLSSAATPGATAPSYANLYGGTDGTLLRAISVDTSGRTVVTGTVSLASLPALVAGTAQIGSVTASISGTVPISISSVTVGNSVTIGSLPAIAGTVTANIAISSTAITSGSFSSLTSATLVPGNIARKMATVYNLGPGQLFVNAGASATTLGGGFMVALSSSDYLECDYTTTTLSALFATAGTASWVSH